MDQGVLERGQQGLSSAAAKLDVNVTGMSCASCVRRVERAVAAVPGVEAVSVNLATERASVTPGAGFDTGRLADALAAAGYPASTETLDLPITGMTCASCVGRVERALLAVPGVRSAEVNLATERARVGVLSGTAGLGELIAAVRRAGYEASYPDSGAGSEGAVAAARGRKARLDGTMAALALAFAAPLLLPMLLAPFGVDIMLPSWAQFALAGVVQLVFGARFYRGAWKALLGGVGNMDTLVALGTSAAFGLSAWELAAGQGGQLYFEASAAVIALVRLGKWLESQARRQAGEAIRALERLRPDRARVRREGAEQEIAAADLRPGDLLVIRPGERIAADGLVREGVGSTDESLLTGESLPVAKEPGSRIVGGALNGEALLLAEVTATGAEGQLARMMRLVEDAQAAKPPVQRLVDRVSAVFVPRGDRHCRLDLHWLVARRGRHGNGGGERRGSPGDRLPVRAGAGDARRHHGGHRNRRTARHPDPRCWGAGAGARNPHRGVRQDWHPDRRAAGVGSPASGAGRDRGGGAAAGGGLAGRQRTPVGARCAGPGRGARHPGSQERARPARAWAMVSPSIVSTGSLIGRAAPGSALR